MDVTLLGTAGPRGWPARGCRCASCGRLQTAGEERAPTALVVDGAFRLEETRAPAGYEIRVLPGTPAAHDLTGPDGARLLYASAPGPLPRSALDAVAGTGATYDLAFLDLVEAPEQLGELRRSGAVTTGTTVVAVHLDHRVPSLRELGRRLAFWGVHLVPDGAVVSSADAPIPRPAAAPRRVLLLGGARSGKSEEAERRLAGEPTVTYVAAGAAYPDDPEWQARVAAHRARRPSGWRTLETIDLAAVVRGADGPLLVDGLGTWLAAVLDECGLWASDPRRQAEERLLQRIDELVTAWRETSAYIVAVTDEVGSGIVPETPSGRRFRDELGRLNRRIAAESEEVALVIAGRVLPLPALPS